MANNIYLNPSSLTALRYLNDANEGLSSSIARLASGNRIQKAGDDPSGLARSSFLEVALRDQRQIGRNAEDAKSVLQVSENGLNEVNNILMRMRELAVSAASNIAGPEEREAIQIEQTSLKEEIDRIAETTTYGRFSLLNGSTPDLAFQVGIGNEEIHRINYPASTIDVRSGTLGVDSIEVGDSDSALSSLETIDEAILKVQAARAQTGAYQGRLDHVASLSQSMKSILQTDLSRVKDTDYAQESAEFVKRSIQQRAAVAVLAQANSQAESALMLLSPIKTL